MPDTKLVGQAVCHPVAVPEPCACSDAKGATADRAGGAVFVLARTRDEYAPDIITNLVKVGNIVANYGGKIMGVAKKVNVLECGLSQGTWVHKMCMLVLQFPSQVLADRWSHSDPVFREKDFPRPGHALEMISIPLLHIPPPGFKTFQITSFLIQAHDADRFQKEYIEEAAKFYHKHKICYGVALTNDITEMRAGWINTKNKEYFAVHMFPNQQVLDTLYMDSEYEALKAVMNCLSVSTTIAFTVT